MMGVICFVDLKFPSEYTLGVKNSLGFDDSVSISRDSDAGPGVACGD
jgi:hypothetical protein